MHNYLKKVFHILPVFLLAVFLCIGVLGVSRYLLEYKFQILDLKEIVWDFMLPAVFTLLSLILMRKRLNVLKHSTPEKGNDIYFFLCGVALCAALVSSQFYYKIKFSQNQTVQNIQQISSDKNVNKIRINAYFVDVSTLSTKFTTDVSGKYGQQLNLNLYFVAAILKDSLGQSEIDLPTVWFAHRFSESVNNRLPDKEKWAEVKKIRKKFYQDSEKFDFYANEYFLRVPNSEAKDVYDDLILNVIENPEAKSITFLSPSDGKFIDDGKSALFWFFRILGIGIFVILFALIFPRFHKPSSHDKRGDDDFQFLLQVFIPSKDLFVTPILINLNVLVFVLLTFLGVNPFFPSTEHLVNFGALTSQFAGGEYWRIISSMFMHAGLMHLLMNMIVLYFTGFFSESIYGAKKFAVIYFLSGIIAGITSLIWRDGALVLVGASGAIFGVLGSFAAALILQNNFRENKIPLLAIFGYLIFNIFVGLISNSDNVAHISGFVSGMIISYVIYSFKK